MIRHYIWFSYLNYLNTPTIQATKLHVIHKFELHLFEARGQKILTVKYRNTTYVFIILKWTFIERNSFCDSLLTKQEV